MYHHFNIKSLLTVKSIYPDPDMLEETTKYIIGSAFHGSVPPVSLLSQKMYRTINEQLLGLCARGWRGRVGGWEIYSSISAQYVKLRCKSLVSCDTKS